MPSEYAVYKGDDLLAIGTVEQLAKHFGVAERSIRFYMTPSYKNRTSEQKGRRFEKLGEIDDSNHATKTNE